MVTILHFARMYLTDTTKVKDKISFFFVYFYITTDLQQ